MHSKKLRSVLVCVCLLVSITTIIGSSSQPTASAAPSPQTLQWAPCPPPPPGIPDAGQQCATLSVPLDYRSPNGQKINLAISRIPAADPAHRRGVLLSNPGGPGGAGQDLPRILNILLPQSVLDKYDLIGFDPRGIGNSTPVSCGLTEDEANQAYAPLTQNGSFTDTTNFVHQVADKCAATSGNIIPFITTANNARDMNQIRLALGEQKISYLGYSYGTYLGAVYTSMFPNNTDRFVLDSAVNPAGVWRQVFRDWGPGGAIRFPDFAKFAASNDSTYHLGSTQNAINQLYFQLINRLKQHPFTVPDGTGSSQIADGTVITDTIFRETVFAALYDDVNFPDQAALWQLIKESPVSSAATKPAKATALDSSIDNTVAAGLSTVCGDVAWSHSPAQYQLELNSDEHNFPMFGELGSNIWPCAFWATNPIEPVVPITPNGPANSVLIVEDTRDPATPYWGAVNMHLALGVLRSRLVSVDQGGHGAAYLKPNQCASASATAFLANGTLPLLDKFCPAEPPSSAALSPNAATQPTDHAKAVQELLRRMQP